MADVAAPSEPRPLVLPPSTVAALPRKRWALVAGLLLSEYLALSVLYDAAPLAAYAGLLRVGGSLGPLAIAIASALYAFGQVPEPAAHEIADACWPLPRVRTRGLTHAVAVVAFFAASARVLGGGAPPSASWAALWACAGLAVTLSALSLALPLRAMRPIVRLAARPVALGFVVGVAAFAAGTASEALWSPLATITFRATAAVLEAVGVGDLVVNPTARELGLRGFEVQIAGVCSGAQGLGVTMVFIATYLLRFRRALRFPRALLLFPVGLLAAYLINVVRLAALMLVGAFVSEEVAFGGFHSKAGWVLNVALALALLFWVRRSPFFMREPPAADAEEDGGAGDNPTLTYLAPMLASIALALLTGLAVSSFDVLYPVRFVGTALALIAVRRGLAATKARPWTWSPSPFVVGVGVLAVWLVLAHHASPEDVVGFRASLAAMSPPLRVGWILSRAAGAVLMAVVEEVAFRGFLMRRLISADFWAVDYRAAARTLWAVAGSSLAFGALHEGAIVAATLAGVAYAAATAVRGRLSDAIVAHVVTNALLVAYTIAFDHWEWLM